MYIVADQNVLKFVCWHKYCLVNDNILEVYRLKCLTAQSVYSGIGRDVNNLKFWKSFRSKDRAHLLFYSEGIHVF
jgi:hypothetical protein